MPSPQDIDSLIEEFNKRGIIVRARERSQNKFQPVLYWDNEMQEDISKLESFIRHVYTSALRWGAEQIPGHVTLLSINRPSIEHEAVEESYNKALDKSRSILLSKADQIEKE